MKNLKLYSEVTLKLELQRHKGSGDGEEKETLSFSALDIERNRLFFASSSNLIYASQLSSFQNGDAWRDTTLPAEVYSVDLEDGDFITAFDYLMEKEALVLGTFNGLLLLFNADDNATEVVGQVEGGVKCIAPSPDGDLLAVVSGSGQLLLMTHDWDLLHETSLVDDQLDGFCVQVTFSIMASGEPNGSFTDTFESSVTWRGDGKYFATITQASGTSSHKRIKVWERDSGALHAASDPKDFMGTVLEWMPSGAKIAAVNERKLACKSPEISFYERNGLPRSSFSVNEPADATVEILKWNCSSDLLAGVVKCDKYDSVKVWYFCNNHWYLKHEIRYSKKDGIRFMWDPVKPLQMICWSLGAYITLYKFISVSAVLENSTAFVIDDSKILITPLSPSLMPPPLSLFNLNFPSPVRDIAPFFKNSKSRLAATLSNGCLCVVDLPDPDIWDELEGREFDIEACICETHLGSFVHHVWLDSHRVLAVSDFSLACTDSLTCNSSNLDGFHGLYLLEIELVCSEDHNPGLVTSSGWHAKVCCRNKSEGPVIGVLPGLTKNSSAVVQLDGGKILEYTSLMGLNIAGQDVQYNPMSFLSSCPWMSLALVSNDGQLKPVLFGLDDIGRLQVGGKTISNNCSTFSFYSNGADQVTTHLIVSTKQDFLFILDMRDSQLEGAGWEPENFIYTAGKGKEKENMNAITLWERGAKIIGVLHGDDATVIMQTTRGNLECVYPRKLVLSSISNALVHKRFRDSLLMVRRHRIDFNVIVDLCGWQTFLQTAPDFVKQVSNLSYITEFVCAVKNVNIMETLYKNYILLPLERSGEDICRRDPDTGNKVSSVLLAIRKALEEQIPESAARELCILTTLARSDPPLLEEALARVKATRDVELSGSRRLLYPSAEEALKHLLWLSDSEAVFEAALGLYDLKLAAIVALNSERDPKEFLPYLQELQQMPGPIMRHNIDIKLRRFKNALKHIVSAGDAYFPDCMDLLKKNPQVFPLGLQLITDPAKRMQVLEAWGDHLSDNKLFEDAAAAYLCCSSFDKAMKAYRDSGNWSGVLTVAGLLKMEKDEIMQLAHELLEELQALGKPGEAAKIALEYCRDVDNGVSLLITAREWEEALRISQMNMREDLVSELKKASIECASTLIGDYEEGLEKVGKYLTRYLAVRQRRLLLAAKLQSDEQPADDVDDDTASEASSNFSGMSAYTTGTRRSSTASVSSSATYKARGIRRQRKRGKIRPGSADEEAALVEHLKGMSLIAGAMRELKSLLVSLMMFGIEETARKLQSVVENFQLSQFAAVRLAEDTVSTDDINEHDHTLENYIKKIKSEPQISEIFSWQSKVLLSP